NEKPTRRNRKISHLAVLSLWPCMLMDPQKPHCVTHVSGMNCHRGLVLYGHCAEGFVIDNVLWNASGSMRFDEPRTSDDMAALDAESAAVAGKTKLDLGYTCVRNLHQKQ